MSAHTNTGSAANTVESLLGGRNYEFVGPLGRGAMGEIHIVTHQVLKRRFALKVIHSRHAKDTHFIDRMRLEAQATARLHHKNIVDVVDFWVAPDGRPCIVMELLQGGTLAHEVTVRGSLQPPEAVEFSLQLLAALAAAHELGVVHRDVKPENLFLHQPPERPRILKVLDFGFARVLPGAPERAPLPPAQPTATGAIMGTPRFASPEALQGERVDARADLFSVGAVLYFMLTGRGPYDRMQRLVEAAFEFELPSAVRGSGITPALDAAVVKATQWRPEERFGTAAEFADTLVAIRDASFRGCALK